MAKLRFNDIEVIDHFEVKSLVVARLMYSGEESYVVFRSDGTEREVVIGNGKLVSGTYQLTRNEIDYFKSGYYKKLKEDL